MKNEHRVKGTIADVQRFIEESTPLMETAPVTAEQAKSVERGYLEAGFALAPGWEKRAYYGYQARVRQVSKDEFSVLLEKGVFVHEDDVCVVGRSALRS